MRIEKQWRIVKIEIDSWEDNKMTDLWINWPRQKGRGLKLLKPVIKDQVYIVTLQKLKK